MLGALKQFAKKLPHPALMRLYYAWYFLREVPRCRAARRQAGLPLFGEVDLAALKGSEVLFVLGSGPSVNQIPAERWQAIARADTVGFNFWLFHPFVPKLYFIESLAHDDYPFAYDMLLKIFEQRAADYAEVPKVVMELQRRGRQTIFDLSPESKRKLYAAYNISALCRDAAELSASIAYLRKQGIFRRSARRDFLFKYASSVTTMLALAANMGYRKVVLCGVDLNQQIYFYQDPHLYPETAALSIEPRGERHGSMVPVPFRVPADQVILEMKRQVLDPAGIELYVESRTSALWPHIPEAPESLFDLPAAEGKAERAMSPAGSGAARS